MTMETDPVLASLPAERPKEYCGLCGVIGSANTLDMTYIGLHSQQHRGQEAAGIAAVFDANCHLFKAPGLVDEVFAKIPQHWRKTKVSHAISHVRYSTAGASTAVNAQPLMASVNGQLVAIAHNGTLSNAAEIRTKLQCDGVLFQTSTDTELILHLAARAMKRCGNRFEDALVEALGRLRGAFCLLVITRDQLMAIRDPYGFRPLSTGILPDGGRVVASETIAIEVAAGRFEREIEPGEMVIWDLAGKERSIRFAQSTRRAHCIFEHVYFARPGSQVFGDSVYEVRKELGRQLARECPVDADVVMPVPDSGVYAALGFAEQSGLTFDLGLSRNHYVGRTFIDPGLTARSILVQRKMQPITEAIRGRRICLIEDSIVRGSTSLARIQTLRDAGAKEIHMRITCPPHRHGCYFGIDFPDREKLIANIVPLDQLAKHLQLDSLGYLTQEGMLRCVKAYPPSDYCCACFDGAYPDGSMA